MTTSTPLFPRCRTGLLSLLRGDEGTIVPIFVGFVWLTALIGVLFFQTGRATDLGAEAQTGADAAALAGAEDLRLQILEWLATQAYWGVPFIPNYPRAQAAAVAFGGINNTVAVDIDITPVGYLSYRVRAEVRTIRALTPAGHQDEDGGFQVGSYERGNQDATAQVSISPSSFLSEGYWTDNDGNLQYSGDRSNTVGGPQGGGVGGGTSSGGCPISASELSSLAVEAGVSEEFVQRSALARYSDCDGGRAVAPMQRQMKISVLRLENRMNEPLELNSAYRSPEYQAELCKRVNGPCAAPGASLHNHGLAIDVQNWQAAAVAVSLDPSIQLCQPLPSNDAVHFSHSSGRECGGQTGATNGGAAGGNGSPQAFSGVGGFGAQYLLSVRLVE